jgi:hypothetical protein
MPTKSARSAAQLQREIDESLDVAKAEKALIRLVEKYKKYERTDPDKPAASARTWSPRDGRLRVIEDELHHEGMHPRRIRIGVAIGSKFASPRDERPPSAVRERQVVVDEVRNAARDILSALVQAHGGYIVEIYGTSYSPLGWVAP